MNRMWGHFMGRGFVNPVDDFGPHNPPSHPELLDKLAAEFQKSGYDVKALTRWIVNSHPYNLSERDDQGEREGRDALQSYDAQADRTPSSFSDSLLTATSAHKAGGDNKAGATRDAWLRQFVIAFANDEGEEGSTFQGTIPQCS